MSQIDPTFHFGKHSGERLSLVEESYLEWLARQDQASFNASLGGIPAPIAAKRELERRKGNRPLDKGLEVESLPITSEVKGGSDVSLALKSTDKIEVCLKSMDQGIELLLKEFLIRTSKEKRFSSWLKGVAQESIKYGVEEDSGNKSCKTYRYMKVKFIINIEDKVLAGVKP